MRFLSLMWVTHCMIYVTHAYNNNLFLEVESSPYMSLSRRQAACRLFRNGAWAVILLHTCMASLDLLGGNEEA